MSVSIFFGSSRQSSRSMEDHITAIGDEDQNEIDGNVGDRVEKMEHMGKVGPGEGIMKINSEGWTRR